MQLGRCLRSIRRVGPRSASSSKAEVEDLRATVVGHHDVGGLQVAMDDPLVVRRGEGLGERAGDLEDALDGEPALRDEPIERRAVDKLHGEEVNAVSFLDREHGDDAGVVKGGESLRLTPETLQPLGIRGHLGGQDLQGHVAPELRVGVPFPAVALEILRFATPPAHLQELVYRGKTYAVGEALERGLVDETVSPDGLLEHACAVAARLATEPTARFRLTKLLLRRPTIVQMKQLASETDADVLAEWKDPKTIQAIRTYLQELKKDR